MMLNRLTAVAVCITVVVCLCTAYKEPDEEHHKDVRGFFPILHQNQPRIFGIFSKPPEPDAPKKTGPGILGHLGNVLQGGTIGIELSARPLGSLLGHAKKIIPGGHETVGQPHYEKPYDPPSKHDNDEDEWEMKEPEKFQPMKPDPESYNWDDIGEDRGGPSTEVPIEDIIMPRLRPKRFIESKIYHVPLTFRSNGKPYRVVEKTVNSIGSKEKL